MYPSIAGPYEGYRTTEGEHSFNGRLSEMEQIRMSILPEKECFRAEYMKRLSDCWHMRITNLAFYENTLRSLYGCSLVSADKNVSCPRN
jgi:hypothetical protein